MLVETKRRSEDLESENKALQERLFEREAALKLSEQKREYLEYQLEKLRRMLFGQSSEKLLPRSDGLVQLDLLAEARHELEAEKAQESEAVEEITYERKKRRAQRKPLPEDLVREKIEVDVDPELRVCPDCGQEMGCLGAEVSELLEYVPALLQVIEYHLKKYACRKCQNGVVQARVPPRPIPKGRPGPGLLAYLLVSKYHDHLPLARLERIFSRAGSPISRQTLCDWTQAAAELLSPVVEALKCDLRRSRLLQADETPVEVRDRECGREKKSRTAWIWTYGIADGEVVYDFSNTRSRDAPLAFLGEFSGYLQSDCYSVYTSLDESGRITHVGDWAHARRRFFDARGEKPEFAELVLAAIQKLFRIERRAREDGLSGAALVAQRREEALPILRKLKSILEAKRSEVLPKSGLGAAIAYSLNNWEALERYVDVPEAKIDNNGAERTMRRIVVGRNNWLFIGHPKAGPRAAVIFSLIESCRRLGIEPLEYFASVIQSLAEDPSRAPELTPRKWRDAERARSTATA